MNKCWCKETYHWEYKAYKFCPECGSSLEQSKWCECEEPKLFRNFGLGWGMQCGRCNKKIDLREMKVPPKKRVEKLAERYGITPDSVEVRQKINQIIEALGLDK